METVEQHRHAAIVRAGLGDIRAFESIVRQYHKLAFGYAISILKDYHLAEDAVQEAFAEVFRTIRNLRNPSAFPSWLRLIVHKQCDRLTRRKRPPEVPYDDQVAGQFESPELMVERKERELSIRSLISKLPDKQRLVTELYYMDGLAQTDIAQFLEIKPSTVRKRLYDSRNRLRKEMAMADVTQMEQSIRELFSNRVSPDLLDKLLKDPSVLEFSGEERNLTVLFADAIGITAKQRDMGLKEFFKYMNNYFGILFDIIVSNQGFIDKIIGDEFMALWGTPANPKDHATQACYTAIEMQRTLRELRESGAEPEGRAFKISIGINSGDALIGNFGPPKFVQYTPLGDTINFGARLESSARKYGVEIAIGEHTYEYAKANIIARKLDDVQVRYQADKIGIYELIASKSTGVPDAAARKLEAFEQGYAAFYDGEYDKSRASFLQALQESDGTDMPSLIYLQRCAEAIRTR